VLGQNVPHYVVGDQYELPDTNFLVAAENTFAAGAGIEIEQMAFAHLVNELEAGLRSGDELWWADSVWPAMVGHLQASRHRAYERVAYDRDRSIADVAETRSTIMSGTSVGLGVFGLATGGTAAVAAGLGGVLLSVLGSPFFQDDDVPDAVKRNLEATLSDLGASPDEALEVVLLLALLSDQVQLPAGSQVQVVDRATYPVDFAEGVDPNTPELVVELRIAGATTSFTVGDDDWHGQAFDALQRAGATIGGEGAVAGIALGAAVNGIVGSIITSRVRAFDDDDEEDEEDDEDN